MAIGEYGIDIVSSSISAGGRFCREWGRDRPELLKFEKAGGDGLLYRTLGVIADYYWLEFGVQLALWNDFCHQEALTPCPTTLAANHMGSSTSVTMAILA
ncbi:unnamed protein product [Citrullus colocynthis]|uniref:Uncharacterized protein n=1 Tax=Citrullus colocynthis TaxID=252529 RepID=A0ABP0YB25_9ROSI